MVDKHCFQRKPVIRFRQPLYPLNDGKIVDLRCDMGQIFSLKSRFILANAVSLLSFTLVACPPLAGDIGYPSISEQDARTMLLEKFAERGINITEQFQFDFQNVLFNADGFDEQKGIGFEYISLSDQSSLPEKGLSIEEIEQLWSWKEKKGPYFLILDQENFQGPDLSQNELFQALNRDIDAFLNDLADRGII